MNRLSIEDQVRIVSMLVEGNSIRSIERMTGIQKKTIGRLLVQVGNACQEFQFRTLQGLTCEHIQCDEIWSFCYSKEANIPEKFKGFFGYGDIYTWVALCEECKLVPTFFVGRRDTVSADYFIRNLSRRIRHKVQITTDGYGAYLDPMENHFGARADFSQVIKIFGIDREDGQIRYSPPACIGTRTKVVIGSPDPAHISTSLIERQNLTMRMHMRRFTRLTNGFSKKIDNLQAAVALHFMYYNFCKVHLSLRMTPAMKAGKASRVFEIADILGLLHGIDPEGTKENPLTIKALYSK